MSSHPAASKPAKPALPPAEHPGERLATYFDNFFKTIIAISTFGSSLTITKLLQTPVQPWRDYGIDKDTVQYYLAYSWLLFILNLVTTSFAASALSMYRPQAVAYFGTSRTTKRRTVLWYATIVTTLLVGALVAAFELLSLVVVAYAGPAGWIALSLTTTAGVIGFGVILYQSPIGSHFDEIEDSDDDTPSGKPSKPQYTTPHKRRPSYYDAPNSAPGRYDDEKNRWSMGSPLAPAYTGDRRPSRTSRPPMHLPRYSESGYDLRADQMLHMRLNRIHTAEAIMVDETSGMIQGNVDDYDDGGLFSSPTQMDNPYQQGRR